LSVDRRRGAIAAAHADSLLLALLASSGDCIKILDLDGSLLFMTEGGQRIMEVTDFSAIQGSPVRRERASGQTMVLRP
jgi:hypothetical protein